MKRSHHSYGSSGAEQSINNESDKNVCYQDLLGLHKTWLNITKNIENIRRNIHQIRQGFVTMSRPNKVHLRINNVEKELSELLDAITVQQRLTSFEQPLGDIMNPVRINA